MNKLIYIGCVLTISFIFFSCQHEIDTFNESPNDVSNAPVNTIFATVQVATFANQSSGLVRFSNIFTQHISGNSFQPVEYTNYIVTEQDVNNEWRNLYSTAMMNASTIINKYGNENPYYNGMAKILMAINLSNATDMWGDVPYNDAFKGLSNNVTPAYQSQQQIYEVLQSLLSDAIVDLKKPSLSNKFLPGSDDLIYGGDTTKWIKAAYSLKARYSLRLSKVLGDATAAQNALNFLNEGAISSNEENMNAVFGTSASNQNQWYAFGVNRANYLKMGKFFVDIMSSTSDPRLAFFAKKTTSGTYVGLAPTQNNINTASNIGNGLAGQTQPIGIITYTETKFIEAEAKLLAGDTSGAMVSFKEAVESSLQNVTSTIDATFVSSVTSDISVKNIITQKYIALFGSLEPYNDYRRTGFPVLSPNSNSNLNVIPLRLPTPQEERLYNPKAVVVSDMITPVWWDK